MKFERLERVQALDMVIHCRRKPFKQHWFVIGEISGRLFSQMRLKFLKPILAHRQVFLQVKGITFLPLLYGPVERALKKCDVSFRNLVY